MTLKIVFAVVGTTLAFSGMWFHLVALASDNAARIDEMQKAIAARDEQIARDHDLLIGVNGKLDTLLSLAKEKSVLAPVL